LWRKFEKTEEKKRDLRREIVEEKLDRS